MSDCIHGVCKNTTGNKHEDHAGSFFYRCDRKHISITNCDHSYHRKVECLNVSVWPFVAGKDSHTDPSFFFTYLLLELSNQQPQTGYKMTDYHNNRDQFHKIHDLMWSSWDEQFLKFSEYWCAVLDLQDEHKKKKSCPGVGVLLINLK